MKMFSDIIVMIEELSNRLLITDKNIVEITELIRLTSFNSISIFMHYQDALLGPRIERRIILIQV